jgi:hypothetical protein
MQFVRINLQHQQWMRFILESDLVDRRDLAAVKPGNCRDSTCRGDLIDDRLRRRDGQLQIRLELHCGIHSCWRHALLVACRMNASRACG